MHLACVCCSLCGCLTLPLLCGLPLRGTCVHAGDMCWGLPVCVCLSASLLVPISLAVEVSVTPQPQPQPQGIATLTAEDSLGRRERLGGGGSR